MRLPRNGGPLDRLLRLVVGVGLLGLYGALEAPAKYFTLLGLLLIATAWVGSSPLYTLLGWTTNSRAGGQSARR
jgi:hypothetical protein